MSSKHSCCVYLGEELASYAFGNDHPFGPLRHDAFKKALYQRQLNRSVDILPPATTTQKVLELFHRHAYIEKVRQLSKFGAGFLDQGDTPAFIGMFEASLAIAGSVCEAIDRLIDGQYKRAFIPIAGLHHARRETAAGFCVINDCGIAIEYLRERYKIRRIAYIDIDAHHGDGVYYSFADDPELRFVDFHEDGRFLYPGSGDVAETGDGVARGTKLNIPMPPGADDELFLKIWPRAESFLSQGQPDFVLMQCGADSIDGDPITHMAYSPATHYHAVRRTCALADASCGGKVIAMGGGGYNLDNIANAWTTVVTALIAADER